MARLGLTIITRDPFLPWKRTERVLVEAQRRGFHTTVALDERSSVHDRHRIFELADEHYLFTPPDDTCATQLNEVVKRNGSWRVLMVADDEEPSADLWDFAQKTPMPLCYAVLMLTPTPDGRIYNNGKEVQIRIVNPKIWEWRGGFDGSDVINGNINSPSVATSYILWHYATFAPEEHMRAKQEAYAKMGTPEEYFTRHDWRGHPEGIIPMTVQQRRQFPSA